MSVWAWTKARDLDAYVDMGVDAYVDAEVNLGLDVDKTVRSQVQAGGMHGPSDLGAWTVLRRFDCNVPWRGLSL